jgi:hypothetical protein
MLINIEVPYKPPTYLCNPKSNVECERRDCNKTCHHTDNVKFAHLQGGKPMLDTSGTTIQLFKVVLCNNDIDKDNEALDVPAMKQIRDKILDIRGVFDGPNGHYYTKNSAKILWSDISFRYDKNTKDGRALCELIALCQLEKPVFDSDTKFEASIPFNKGKVENRRYYIEKDKTSEVNIITSVNDVYEWRFTELRGE